MYLKTHYLTRIAATILVSAAAYFQVNAIGQLIGIVRYVASCCIEEP
jgi:hypothetical protein